MQRLSRVARRRVIVATVFACFVVLGIGAFVTVLFGLGHLLE